MGFRLLWFLAALADAESFNEETNLLQLMTPSQELLSISAYGTDAAQSQLQGQAEGTGEAEKRPHHDYAEIERLGFTSADDKWSNAPLPQEPAKPVEVIVTGEHIVKATGHKKSSGASTKSKETKAKSSVATSQKKKKKKQVQVKKEREHGKAQEVQEAKAKDVPAKAGSKVAGVVGGVDSEASQTPQGRASPAESPKTVPRQPPTDAESCGSWLKDCRNNFNVDACMSYKSLCAAHAEKDALKGLAGPPAPEASIPTPADALKEALKDPSLGRSQVPSSDETEAPESPESPAPSPFGLPDQEAPTELPAEAGAVPVDIREDAGDAEEPEAEAAEPTAEEAEPEVAEPAAEEEAAEPAAEEAEPVVIAQPAVEEAAERAAEEAESNEAAEPAAEEPAAEEAAEVADADAAAEAAEPAAAEEAEPSEVTEPAVEEEAESTEVAEPAAEEAESSQVAEEAEPEVAEPAAEEAESTEVAEPAAEEAEPSDVVEPAAEEAESTEVAEPATEGAAEPTEVAEPVAEEAEPSEEVEPEPASQEAESSEVPATEVQPTEASDIASGTVSQPFGFTVARHSTSSSKTSAKAVASKKVSSTTAKKSTKKSTKSVKSKKSTTSTKSLTSKSTKSKKLVKATAHRKSSEGSSKFVLPQAVTAVTKQEVAVPTTTFALSRLDALGAGAGTLGLAQQQGDRQDFETARTNMCSWWLQVCGKVATAGVCDKYASLCR
ncbi:unnamed protein product [Symbiodinium sp. KB8]|nr:unnamed protein product [Symbiodinium sp. KB8]